jgi:hypothetical protein
MVTFAVGMTGRDSNEHAAAMDVAALPIEELRAFYGSY